MTTQTDNLVDEKLEFAFSAIMAVIMMAAFIFLIASPNIEINGIFYILPCIADSLRTITIDKHRLSPALIYVNIGIFIISGLCIVLCILVLVGKIEMNKWIEFLFLSYFAKNISHARYYWKRY